MTDYEFEKCPVCGKLPNIINKNNSWELVCACGKCIPGCKSREQLLRGWKRVIERESRSKNEKGKKKSNIR